MQGRCKQWTGMAFFIFPNLYFSNNVHIMFDVTHTITMVTQYLRYCIAIVIV